jgi:hypothetical protein
MDNKWINGYNARFFFWEMGMVVGFFTLLPNHSSNRNKNENKRIKTPVRNPCLPIEIFFL